MLCFFESIIEFLSSAKEAKKVIRKHKKSDFFSKWKKY
jgi:hypothetical protein